MKEKLALLADRLADERSRKVVFVSHCLLNENTRYLGGAFRPGCVDEVVDELRSKGLGIVQMGCPEQKAWGGVLKRFLWLGLDLKSRSNTLFGMRSLFLSAFSAYTRLVCRWMAREIVSQIEDYRDSGFEVAGIVGVDGSPSCGVDLTIDMKRSFGFLAGVGTDELDRESINERAVKDSLAPGMGLFVDALRKRLSRRNMEVDFYAHDLTSEMAGGRTALELDDTSKGESKMKKDLLPLLRDPDTHDPLEFTSGPGGERLLNPKTGKGFELRGGIPFFLEDPDVSGSNRKFQSMYDRVAPFYDIPYRLAYRFFRRKFLKTVDEVWRDAVEVREGDRVLEVSIGTGFNRRYFPRDVSYVGLDISPGMLRQCEKNLARWGLGAALVRGNAESLPFADDSFDSVFHFGGVNFFNDRARAISEMIRVAKPGTRIVISDENEKFMKFYLPTLWKFTSKRREPIVPPVDLVPPGMLEVRCEDGWKGRFYRISFRKPR